MKMLIVSTVNAFFRKRAGLFLVLLGVLFGFLSSAEHYAFAQFFLTDPNGMYLLFAIWTCYTLFCIQFLNNAWRLPEYQFVFHASLWRTPIRTWRFILMGLGFLQPIIGYGIYLSVVAIQENRLNAVLPAFPAFMIFAGLIALFAEWRIRHPTVFEGKRTTQLFKWPFRRPASRLYWILEWLFRERGMTLLAGKTGALLFTAGTLLYYSTDTYDVRLPAIGLSFAYILNLGISYELYGWETETFLWERSMPVKAARRFAGIAGFHALVILPETLVIVRNQLLTWQEIMQLYLLGLGLLILVHMIFYKKEGLPENSGQTFLFGFVGLTFLILYKVPLIVIALAMFGLSWFGFLKWRRL